MFSPSHPVTNGTLSLGRSPLAYPGPRHRPCAPPRRSLTRRVRRLRSIPLTADGHHLYVSSLIAEHRLEVTDMPHNFAIATSVGLARLALGEMA